MPSGRTALPVPGVPREGPAIETETDAERDAETVRRVVAGDRDAFGVLVARYGRRIHDLASRMLRDASDAEDVAQQAFLNAYRALARFDGRRPFRHWLLVIATNLCRNRLSERRRRPRPLATGVGGADDVAVEPAAPAAAAPGEAADLRADVERVRAAVERLPESQRLAMVLRYSQGLSLEEVSEITEVPVATVKTHLHRARAALRRVLAPEGETSRPARGTEGEAT